MSRALSSDFGIGLHPAHEQNRTPECRQCLRNTHHIDRDIGEGLLSTNALDQSLARLSSNSPPDRATASRSLD